MQILLVEDDRAVREAVTRVLELDGHSVRSADNGTQGLAMAQRHHDADVLILDWMLPGIEGIEILRSLRSQQISMPVLMLTAKDTVAERVAGLESGADDYLVKPFAIAELRARIVAVTRRQDRTTSDEPAAGPLTCDDLVMDTTRHQLTRAAETITLSRIEWQLLQTLLEHQGQLCTRSQLHMAVWDYDFGSDSNTLEVHIGYLRRKLEAGDRARLIHTVRGYGYILEQR